MKNKEVQITHCSIQGVRPRQEDRFVVVSDDQPEAINGWLMAVFDGHGGSAVSELAARMFPGVFVDFRNRHPRNYRMALAESVKELDRRLEFYELGTTIVAAYISRSARKVILAWMGDSIALVSWDSGLYKTAEHNIFNSHERKAAISRGAVVKGSYLYPGTSQEASGINLTRALGDRDCDFFNREPESEAVPLNASSQVLLASDGLLVGEMHAMPPWIPLHLEQKVDAAGLVGIAAPYSCDNITAIVWRRN